MGSIIGPILAELSMCNIDHDVVNIKGIIELYRYVDDCFLIYDDNIIQANKILEHVNKIDNDIKFDLEPECNCQLPFLDILVTRHKDKTTFKKYKKPCTIDSVIHFTSEVPTYIKKNTFYMYLDKIMQRTTYDTDISNEIEDIIKTYLLNGYSKRMISNWLNKKYVNAHKQPIDNTAYKFLKIPYVTNIFERIKSKLVKYNIILVPEHRNSLHKEINVPNRKANIWDQKNVVYKFECDCTTPKSYIGETSRELKVRFNEHISAIAHNNDSSAVAAHCNNEGCQIVKDTVKILRKEPNTYKRRWYEHLEIIKNKEKIMNNNSGQKLHESWYAYLTRGGVGGGERCENG
ncbi:uncharacterized protein LOC111615734 [Centruroides sculpturatus]|uniref:uncharacterized protein LOC111615734 n=1 Tax=Centruroides sculpturatus TaxID=218467 RepID=UPI000C6E2F34|nr:uncharacterized protein LOC111615734 [Centruroides sculpturatus]